MDDERLNGVCEDSFKEVPDKQVIPLWLWNKKEKEFFGFSGMNWIRVFLIFIIGILIGGSVKCDYVSNSVTNQCNKYILENYEHYDDFTDAFSGIHPDDALDMGFELDIYNIPINTS